MVTPRSRQWARLACAAWLGTRAAGAEGAPAPRLTHAPPAVHEDCAELSVAATIDRPELLKTAWLVYGGATPREVPFRRASAGPWLAVVPASDTCGAFAYAIELELRDGTRVAAFAHRGAPHEVVVQPSSETARERALLARLDGRRSVVASRVELARFGATTTQVRRTPSEPATPTRVPDQTFRVQAGYTYRMLGVVAEFGIEGGVVRGTSVVPGETSRDKLDVGLNYGAPRVLVRATDWLHVDATMLTSVTEVGFSVGGGAALVFGDPWGAKLTLGFESVQVFGSRGFTRMDLPLGRRAYVAPIVEVTNMPHADRTGVRLLVEGRFDLGQGWGLSALGGYQARDAASGGPAAGVGVAYAF